MSTSAGIEKNAANCALPNMTPMWFKSGGTVYVNQKERDRSDFVEYRLMPLYGLSMLFGVGIGVRLGWWDIDHKGPYSKF